MNASRRIYHVISRYMEIANLAMAEMINDSQTGRCCPILKSDSDKLTEVNWIDKAPPCLDFFITHFARYPSTRILL
jgi:hypothetical protein